MLFPSFNLDPLDNAFAAARVLKRVSIGSGAFICSADPIDSLVPERRLIVIMLLPEDAMRLTLSSEYPFGSIGCLTSLSAARRVGVDWIACRSKYTPPGTFGAGRLELLAMDEIGRLSKL